MVAVRATIAATLNVASLKGKKAKVAGSGTITLNFKNFMLWTITLRVEEDQEMHRYPLPRNFYKNAGKKD